MVLAISLFFLDYSMALSFTALVSTQAELQTHIYSGTLLHLHGDTEAIILTSEIDSRVFKKLLLYVFRGSYSKEECPNLVLFGPRQMLAVVCGLIWLTSVI
jgi:hypothetical protein